MKEMEYMPGKENKENKENTEHASLLLELNRIMIITDDQTGQSKPTSASAPTSTGTSMFASEPVLASTSSTASVASPATSSAIAAFGTNDHVIRAGLTTCSESETPAHMSVEDAGADVADDGALGNGVSSGGVSEIFTQLAAQGDKNAQHGLGNQVIHKRALGRRSRCNGGGERKSEGARARVRARVRACLVYATPPIPLAPRAHHRPTLVLLRSPRQRQGLAQG